MFQPKLLAAICAVVALVAPIACMEAAARELRLSHQLPETDARHKAARVLAAEVKKRIPDLAIKIYPNSSLKIPPPEQYEAMLEGKIDMTIYPMGYASAKIPELSIVTLPGVPANAEVAALLKGSEFEEKLQQLCEEKGFRILTWWWLDGGMASRTHPITGPASIKGMTARSGGGNDFNSMLAAAGAKITDMPLTEVRSAMQAGKLDVAQNSFELFVSMRFHEVAKSVTVGGHGTATLFVPLLISKAVWEELSDAERRALEDAAAASDIYFEATQRESQEAAIDVFNKAGVKVQALEFQDYADWLLIAKDGPWKRYRSMSPRAAELFGSLLRSFIDSSKR
jgi:TRAP-type C4-dicarboxylate transport system substrate-binding protein